MPSTSDVATEFSSSDQARDSMSAAAGWAMVRANGWLTATPQSTRALTRFLIDSGMSESMAESLARRWSRVLCQIMQAESDLSNALHDASVAESDITAAANKARKNHGQPARAGFPMS